MNTFPSSRKHSPSLSVWKANIKKKFPDCVLRAVGVRSNEIKYADNVDLQETEVVDNPSKDFKVKKYFWKLNKK